MTRAASNTRGADLVQRYYRGRAQAQRAPRSGARQLPILMGVTTHCGFSLPIENVLADAGDLLINSRRVFKHGNSVVLEVENGIEKKIVALATAYKVASSASALLANLFICEQGGNGNSLPIQFPPPPGLAGLLFTNEPLADRLPKIEQYALRPVFDENFTFRGPGWHSDVGILVHGPTVEPILSPVSTSANAVRDRLPPRLAEMLQDFCFKDDCDLVNAVGVLVTGLLLSQFISNGKAVPLLDGNQPGIGKTLLARVAGIVLDGKDPKAIHFTADDEELSKRACATLRENPTSVLLIDNAKVKGGGEIASPFLEANSMAPEISLRILKESANFTRPNDLLWFLTMNLTKASSDLVSRCVPIRFFFEGDPKDRNFRGRDPLDVARRYREVILGELAGMVIRWNQRGRPPGRQRHRLSYWAEVIGGILDANGLTGFLSNLNEAAEQFNTGLDELAAFAEAAIRMNSPMVRFLPCPQSARGILDIGGTMSGVNNVQTAGLRAGELEPVFECAGVLREELDRAKSAKSKATLIGNFLSKYLNLEVAIEVNGRTGKAVLKQELGAARAKFYRIEVSWTDPAIVPPDSQAPDASSTLGTVPIPTAADVVAAATTCPQAPTVRGSESTMNTSGNTEEW